MNEVDKPNDQVHYLSDKNYKVDKTIDNVDEQYHTDQLHKH